MWTDFHGTYHVYIFIFYCYSNTCVTFVCVCRAEQLVFDGLGNMFVSEAVRGELWRVYLCKDKLDREKYCSEIYLTNGFSQFGGLVVSPDGLTLYAGVTFDDKSHGLISVPTTGNSTWTTVTKNSHQPNGLIGDFKRNMLY